MCELIGVGFVLILSHTHHPFEYRIVTLGVPGGNVGPMLLDKGYNQLLCSLEVVVYAVPGWQEPDQEGVQKGGCHAQSKSRHEEVLGVVD